MLRAIRFAAKLGFTISDDAAAPIHDLGHLLHDVPPARLFDEVLKLFQSGHAVRSFELLVEHGLLRYLFPATSELMERPDGRNVETFIRQGLANTDARIDEDKPISPMFLYGVFLWPAVCRLTAILQEREGMTEYVATQEALARLTLEQVQRTALPKRFSAPMKEMLTMQRRFRQRRGQRAARLLEHKRFRAAYDFLLLRAEVGEVDRELAEWWTAMQEQAPEEQQQKEPGNKRKRRSRRGRRGRPRKRASDAAGG